MSIISFYKNGEVIAIGTILVSTGSYVPEQRLTNSQLTEMVETSDEWIVQRTGIRERRIASNMQTSELAIPAAHITNKFEFFLCMLPGMAVRPSGLTAKGF